MSKKKSDFFWASYADLMTSLFFIMLVLFVLTVTLMKQRQITTEEELEKIKRIVRLEEQFQPLVNGKDFYYLDSCKKFVAKDLMGIEIFEPNKTVIKAEYESATINIGRKLETFLVELNKTNKGFSYLLVIEGNMANKWDQSISFDNTAGFEISYKRALAVYQLWGMKGIDFRQYNAEVLICGSGFNGLCRDQIEENNKRFSIQIIPKVSHK